MANTKVKSTKPKKHRTSKTSTERVITTTLPSGTELQEIIKRIAHTSPESSKHAAKEHILVAKHLEKAAELHRKEAGKHKRYVKKMKKLARKIHAN